MLILFISLYLFSITEGVPKTSQETGNDIEKFLVENQGNGLNTSSVLRPKDSQKKPDKFIEDLIEVQRTYRNLKQKWQRIMEEKSEVMRLASDVPTTTTSTAMPTTTPVATSAMDPNIQEIDVDVFEAPEKFQDISDSGPPSAFDDVAFVDISSGVTTRKPTKLEEIQKAIREAFGKKDPELQNKDFEKALINVGGWKPNLEEVIGVTGSQRDGPVTQMRVDHTTPTSTSTTSTTTLAPTTVTTTTTTPQTTEALVSEVPTTPEPVPTLPEAPTPQIPFNTVLEQDPRHPKVLHTLVDPRSNPKSPKSLISTFGSPQGPPRTPRNPIRPQIATEWRRKLQLSAQEQDAQEQDPFEITVTSTVPTTTTVPSTTSTTSLPPHILPESKFVSSGASQESVPSPSFFRYPDHVQIPFFGSQRVSESGEREVGLKQPRVLETPVQRPQRPTTPEPSGEVEDEEEEVEVPMSEVEDKDPIENEVEAEYDTGTENVQTSTSDSEDIEEITASETSTAIPIDKNEDYVEETFSQETPESRNLNPNPVQNFDEAIQKAQIPESFGIGKAPDSFPEDSDGFLDSGNSEDAEDPEDHSTSSNNFGGSFGIGKAPEPPSLIDAVESLLEDSGKPIGPPGSSSFGIGRSPPGSAGLQLGSPPGSSNVPKPPGSQSHGVVSFGSKNAPKEFPTLISQEVESFFADNEEPSGSSALGSFGSGEKSEVKEVMNIPVEQHLEILEDPVTTTTTTTTTATVPPIPTKKVKPHMVRKTPEQMGIFETQSKTQTKTKIATINQKAYRPPMFPSALSSEAIQMPSPGNRNPYFQRTTIPPIGPHGLAEIPTNDVFLNTVDMELPALGMDRDNGIMNRARREYQKEFEQQIRDVRMIDEEINKISQINEDGRSKTGQRCSQAYAHTLSLPQIQQMSSSLGLGDVAAVIKKASDLTTNHRGQDDISQLEVDLEEKRKLIAKVEILLSLAESRALLFDLLKEQKKIVEKMENRALDLLEKTNFRPAVPSPFSAASDISELSSAVQQVLNTGVQKRGWSLMKKNGKGAKKIEKRPEPFAIIPEIQSDQMINKKTGHLQETAEIVEPILPSQNDQFGRQPVPAPVIVHRRPLPVAPPTMSPFSFGRPAQRAANRLVATQPITPPRFTPPTDEEITESETVHELIDMLHEDIVKLPEDEQQNVCRQVQCDFEKADLCNFESSHDETTRLRTQRRRTQKLRKRDKREVDLLEEQTNISDDLLPYTFRAWSIWAGRKAQRQKQIDIGPDFSPHNTHFAAVFLEPQQAGILSVPLILSGTSTRLRLKLFEGSRGIRLRVCCDRYCPLETEQGLYRGHRMWLRKTVTCPANTQTLSFECLNDGPDRGACGVDEVFVDSTRCHQFFSEGDQS